MSQSQEETQEVMDLNDTDGKYAMASRHAEINESEGGVHYRNFQDVQLKALSKGQ